MGGIKLEKAKRRERHERKHKTMRLWAEVVGRLASWQA